MVKALFIILVCFYGASSYAAEELKTLRTAVAEGYIDGLHSKYLRYIAQQLSLPITIDVMPFARRVKEIKNGELDIIVGIQRTKTREDEFIYIKPYYESLSYRFFSLTKNRNTIKKYEDLQGKLVGVNRHAKYFSPFDTDESFEKIAVSSLKQNIDLLLYGRTDVFIHYEESTLPKLADLKLTNQISKTVYQPHHLIEHYIAISNKSPLMDLRKQLQQVVKKGIENGDFINIRQAHYTSLNNG
ncbi:MAG: transporter substrate-binding domain-containing protein [Colwellia sp.]|nr:transporter substrate-binding domain-containing protein [Colwellia sp.]